MDPFTLAILLYLAGLLLAFLDLFLPSGGMLIILAIVAAIASVLFGFRSSYTFGIGMMALIFFSIPIFALLAIKIWPKTPIGRRVILNTPRRDQEEQADPLLGKVFLAASPLMPAGQIKVGHRNLGAIAEDGIIESGKRVKVVDKRERNYIVKQTSDPLSTLEELDPSSTSAESATEEGSTPSDYLDIPASELGLDSLDEES